MFDPKLLKNYATSIASGSNILSKSWRSVVASSALIFWLVIGYILLEIIWIGRGDLAKKAYKFISAGDPTASPILDPWYQIPAEEFPEFWVCDEEIRGCVVDLAKKQAIAEILTTLRAETGAVRSLFSVYGYSYRRLAVESYGARQRPIDQALWSIPLSQPGFRDTIEAHENGDCTQVTISDLPEGSLLKIEAPLYNARFLENCPVDALDLPYYLEGYVNVSFGKQPEDIAGIERKLKKAAEDIEAIMGYDALPNGSTP